VVQHVNITEGGQAVITYTKEELAALHSQIVSNLEQAWEIAWRE